MATTKIGTVQADERGFQTKKAARNSIRAALEGIGLTCGLFSREGKVYTALLTNSDVQVSAAPRDGRRDQGELREAQADLARQGGGGRAGGAGGGEEAPEGQEGQEGQGGRGERPWRPSAS